MLRRRARKHEQRHAWRRWRLEQDKRRKRRAGGYLGKPKPKAADEHQHLLERLIGAARLRTGSTTFLPEDFSFLTDPDRALTAMAQLLHSANGDLGDLDVSYGDTSQVDICAKSVLDVVVRFIQRRWRQTQSQRNVTILPPGSQASLQIVNPGSSDDYFPLRSGRARRLRARRSAPAHSAAADALTTYFNHCLETQGHMLTVDGEARFLSIIAELLGNAEEHARRFEWHLAGHLSRRPDGRGQCNIAVFNLGPTIAGTLREGKGVDLRNELARLDKVHSFDKAWTKENLATLYAIQDGVSRLRGLRGKEGKGAGLAELFEFIQSVGCYVSQQKQIRRPLMGLVSGATHIRFDKDYELRDVGTGGERHRRIAFNGDNDLCKPPDPGCVRALDGYFPGTIISMRFFLDSGYLAGGLNGG